MGATSRRVVLAAALLAAAAGVVFWAMPRAPRGEPAAAAPVAPASPRLPAPRAVGGPEWPRGEASMRAQWKWAAITFPAGGSALLYPDRVRSPHGRPVKLVVERADAAGNPLTGVKDMEVLVDSPGRPAFKVGVVEDMNEPGRYHATVSGDALGIGQTGFMLVASQSARPNVPGAFGSAETRVEIVGGVRFAGPPSARWEGDRLLIDVPLSTRTATRVVVRAELVAGTEILAELGAEADLAEGEGVVTLDAGAVLAPDDPRVPSLALADGTALVPGGLPATGGDEPRWTDFWLGPRALQR